MLLFGASGHAKVIYDCLVSKKINLEVIFDDDKSKIKFLEKIPVKTYDSHFQNNEEIIIAIGDNKIRKLISKKIVHRFGTVFHESSIISPYSSVEEGTVVFQNAIIQSGSKIGKHCIINTKASIDHDCTIGDFVHIGPNSTVCGGVFIGEGTFLGAGCTIIPNLKIGSNVTIGAGSIVLKNVPDNVLIFGNPAKIIKKK